MTRYFPEVVDAGAGAAAGALRGRRRAHRDPARRPGGSRGSTSSCSGQRIHPAASRVKLLAEKTPADFVAFDLLALGDESLTERAVRAAPGPAGGGAGRASGRRCTSPR